MEISKDVKTHALITWGKTHYFINSSQEITLRSLSIGDEICLEGCTEKVSNIRSILTIQKYYETYPDRRTENINYSVNSPGELPRQTVSMSSERKKRAIQSMIDAFKKHFEGRPIPRQSQEMLDKMVVRFSN